MLDPFEVFYLSEDEFKVVWCHLVMVLCVRC
jgi:hypothetical protein